MRGRNRSSANFVRPVTLATASTLGSDFPTTRRSAEEGVLPLAIQRLPRRHGVLVPHPLGGELDRFVDLEVAGAAAEVAAQRFDDRLPRGRGIAVEQSL